MTGVLPSIKGVSWLGVVSMERVPSALAMSHAHPLPNNAPGAAAAPHCSLKDSKEPKEESMALLKSPVGSPPPCPDGPMISQNMEWFECPPPLFLTAVR